MIPELNQRMDLRMDLTDWVFDSGGRPLCWHINITSGVDNTVPEPDAVMEMSRHFRAPLQLSSTTNNPRFTNNNFRFTRQFRSVELANQLCDFTADGRARQEHPGSKGVIRLLASAEQTAGAIAIFQSTVVLSVAPGPHYHSMRTITSWSLKDIEPFDGLLPENDNCDLKALLIPKVMATKHRFDVVFQRDYNPPERLSDWEGWKFSPQQDGIIFSESEHGGRAGCLGGLRHDHSSIRRSAMVNLRYPASNPSTYTESLYSPEVEGEPVWNRAVLRDQGFAVEFESRYIRILAFTSGNGIEHLVHSLGKPFQAFVLPD
ncbi:hypothetical protein FQN50_003114 [Emmonsiellopsis sp. PD_5]|nr:hypothetical protein FQN50_003114 [Emmonsiellopsis sp. PD_5]